MQGSAQEKKKNVFQPEKRSRFQKNYRRRHPTPIRARTNITPQTYGTEEVCSFSTKALLITAIGPLTVAPDLALTQWVVTWVPWLIYIL